MTARATLYRHAYPLLRILFRLFGRFIIEVRCVVEHEGRVLLVQHNYGREVWCLPGGAARPWEEPAQAALREVYEEVGIRLREARPVPGYSSNKNNRPTASHCYYAITTSPAFEPDPGEIARARWFDPRDLPQPISADAKLALSLTTLTAGVTHPHE